MKTLFASLVLSAALTAPTFAQPGQDLTRLLTTFATQAAVALENARLQAALAEIVE